jgi:hypothetical protein
VSSPGLSNRPYGLGPTAHPSYIHTRAGGRRLWQLRCFGRGRRLWQLLYLYRKVLSCPLFFQSPARLLVPIPEPQGCFAHICKFARIRKSIIYHIIIYIMSKHLPPSRSRAEACILYLLSPCPTFCLATCGLRIGS